MPEAPGFVSISHRTIYVFPEGSEYVVPFDAGHDKPDNGVDEAEADVLVPVMAELEDDEELVPVEELAITLEELLLVEEDVITAEELLDADEVARIVDALLLAEELAMVDELESDTAPATRRPAFVAPSYTKTPGEDFI